MFKFTGNQEFTFDVDVSNLPCGFNGALYFVSMDADGGLKKYSTNKAGAKYGTGYCDAQCPRDLKFINGEVGHDRLQRFGSDTQIFAGKCRRLEAVFQRCKCRRWRPWFVLRRDGYLGSEFYQHSGYPTFLFHD
jgi:hypothetical protein